MKIAMYFVDIFIWISVIALITYLLLGCYGYWRARRLAAIKQRLDKLYLSVKDTGLKEVAELINNAKKNLDN